MSASGSSEISGASRWLAALAAPTPTSPSTTVNAARINAVRIACLPPQSMSRGGSRGRANRFGALLGLQLAFRVVEAAERVGLVRERRQVGDVVRVDAVAERQAVADQDAADYALGDVDHVVLEPSSVRIAGEVAADHAEAVALADGGGRRDRQVQADLVGRRRAGVVQVRLLQAGEQHRHEVGAVRLLEGTELRVELVEQLRQDRARVVLLELLVLVRPDGVPLVLQL